jgi:hypothetical protein
MVKSPGSLVRLKLAEAATPATVAVTLSVPVIALTLTSAACRSRRRWWRPS